MTKVWLAALVVCVTIPGGAAASSSTRFTQQLNPVECTYTSVSTDLLQTSVATVCADGMAPTLDSVTVTDTEIILTGHINVQNPFLVRFWINGNWYTLGVYQGLTVAGGVATLVLPAATAGLSPGYYSVVIEVAVVDSLGLVYKSVYPDALYIPLKQITSTLVETGTGSTVTRYIKTGNVGYIADQQSAPAPGSSTAPAKHQEPMIFGKELDDYVLYDVSPPVVSVSLAGGAVYMAIRRWRLEKKE